MLKRDLGCQTVSGGRCLNGDWRRRRRKRRIRFGRSARRRYRCAIGGGSWQLHGRLQLRSWLRGWSRLRRRWLVGSIFTLHGGKRCRRRRGRLRWKRARLAQLDGLIVARILVEQISVIEKLRRGGACLADVLQTQIDELLGLLVEDLVESRGLRPLRHFAVDLRGVAALSVRVLAGDHLEHAHAKRVDVDLLVVILVIQLRRHELGGAEDTLCCSLAHQSREAQISNLDLRVVAVDEDVLALEVTVDDVVAVQILEPFEDLPAPLLHYLALDELCL
mmetsp:Transcript_2268/g.5141  ORF Transcript_2268/g.5141 Transcript_2268/m.5141 type:complete len:277 (+) Transcript_2268:343-1173(+)